jgi:hypothetical protein
MVDLILNNSYEVSTKFVPQTTGHSTRNVPRTQEEKKRESTARRDVGISLLGLELKKQAKQGKPIVGFYRDKDGKTKPITKSVAELSRKTLVKDSHKFKGVVARVRDVSQKLEDLMEELDLPQNHLLLLTEQQKQLAAQNKESPLLDKEMQKTKEKAALLKNQVRMLGC